MSSNDDLYASPRDKISGFRFDEATARVFDDMIRRSVPGYETVVAMSGGLAERFAHTDSRLYDLGCSLGATTFSLAQGVKAGGCRVIAVDNSEAMLSRLNQRLASFPTATPINTKLADIAEVDIENASVVAMNYTLQFIAPSQRDGLMKKISAGMLEGGVLILSEKVEFEDAAMDDLMADLYHDFKRRQGYSDLEISQKRTALENVLIRESISQHQQRLLSAGFSRVETWFQCFNFVSMMAFK